MQKFVLLLFIAIFPATNAFAQYRSSTTRDTTRYNENNLDIRVFRSVNNIQNKFVNTFINVTNASFVPASIGAPIGLYITSRINKNPYDESSAVLLALSEITNEFVTQAFKYTFKRNRPFRTLNKVYFTDTNSVRGTYSFPSGHASGAFTIATLLTLRYPDKPMLISGLFTYAVIVSLGRIYLGVHYPSDILGGMFVGAGSAALIYSLRKPITNAKNNLFNQSERTDSYSNSISTTGLLISLAATDLINYYFMNSKSKILRNSIVNYSSSERINYLNFSYSF